MSSPQPGQVSAFVTFGTEQQARLTPATVAVVEDVEDLLRAGEHPEMVAARLGVRLDSLRKLVRRAGRGDLLPRQATPPALIQRTPPEDVDSRPRLPASDLDRARAYLRRRCRSDALLSALTAMLGLDDEGGRQ